MLCNQGNERNKKDKIDLGTFNIQSATKSFPSMKFYLLTKHRKEFIKTLTSEFCSFPHHYRIRNEREKKNRNEKEKMTNKIPITVTFIII